MVTKQEEFALLEKIVTELNSLKNAQDKATLELKFNEQEVKALKRVAAREMAWAGVGLIASSYKQIITYLGFFIMTYLVVKGYVAEWVISLLKN